MRCRKAPQFAPGNPKLTRPPPIRFVRDVVGSGDIPVKSCPVESVFGTLDNTARSTLNGGTSVLVTKGRAMAQYNHAYATEEEAERKANKRIPRRRVTVTVKRTVVGQ